MTEEGETILRPLLTANPAVVTWEFAQQCRRAAELLQVFASHISDDAPSGVKKLAKELSK